MIIKFRKGPFEKKWHLCNYVSKKNGYDELSKSLFHFKDGKNDVFPIWANWTIHTLLENIGDISMDYCVRVLGSKEIHSLPKKPLNLLGLHIETHLGIRFLPTLLAKKRLTKEFKGMNEEQRVKELKDVYYINETVNLNKKNILVIDDIRTTGTTTNYIAELLKKDNNVNCYLFTLAQTEDFKNSTEIIELYESFK